ncbi:MAG TPA: Rieske 2Fe-2S domain-containing protein [Anaerolineales bacterium]|nr:Rieske 2Fe-2S domain-containing protein [Anaerolineales bacterium]
MGPRPDLFPYPNGWYAFGMSDELAPGKLLARKFMGQEVVVFRTDLGKAYAVDAYCPHLGAHFGYGGSVHGEVLQCPFHGFQFNGQGTCVRTGYDTPIPPSARLRTWHLREQDGLLLLYFHSRNEDPAWEVPCLGTTGWTRLIYKSFVLHDHPQETTENSVDLGHFSPVHRYRDLRVLKEFESAGPHLSTACAVKRALKILGVEWTEFDFEFETQIYGLGYSLVNVYVPRIRLTARLWVLPTSIDEDRVVLRLALRAKSWQSPLGALLSPLIASFVLRGFAHDASQDFPIWEHKRYTNLPALAKGDGPIGKYRQWAKQFYC